MKTLPTVTVTLFGATLLTACVNLDQTPNDDNTQRPNPAAAFCANEGGNYNLDNGNCELEDGTVVDGWQFYREHNQDTQ